jgi:phage terminase large subunit-like protein
MLTISTQSADPHSVMSELVRYARDVREGNIADPQFHGVIYAAEPDEDPWDEATWRRCNPALGDFKSLEQVRREAEQAKRLPARENTFKLLHLNMPVDTVSRFLNRADWEACAGPVDARALHGQRCFLGLDLSAVSDLTACVAYFPDTGDVLAWHWAPHEDLETRERQDGVPYSQWVREGWLEVTEGRAIDRHIVARRLAEIADDYDVQVCAYDRWRITELRKLLADENIRLELQDHGQGYKDMSPSLDAVEAAVLRGELRHNGNPLLTWQVANAIAESDPAGGRKLNKAKVQNRIDGLVALCMAVGIAHRTKTKRPSVYARRGVQAIEPAAKT